MVHNHIMINYERMTADTAPVQIEALTDAVSEVTTPPAKTPEVLRPKAFAEKMQQPGRESMTPSPKEEWLKKANFWENFHSVQKSVRPTPVLPKSQYGAIFKKLSLLPEEKDQVVPETVMAAAAEIESEIKDTVIEMPTETKKKSGRFISFLRRIGRAIRNVYRRLRQKN